MSSKARPDKCAVVIEHDEFSVRAYRVGIGPLIMLWVHEDGKGGRGIILDVEQSTELIEGLNDLLDEIEEVSTA